MTQIKFQGIDFIVQFSLFELWLEHAWLGAKYTGKTLRESLKFALLSTDTALLQSSTYRCSIFKAKYDQVFSVPS